MDKKLFEKTSLWQRTLAPSDDEFEPERTRLRSSYDSMRRNTAHICAQIQKDVPSLTLHDVNHLDALWAVADLIAGKDYPMTPSEAYLFGVAVLLHDTSHSIYAFEKGMDDLKNTPEWSDTVVSILSNNTDLDITHDTIKNPPTENIDEILFHVLRGLHAKRAEELAFFKIPSRTGGTSNYLLEDNELRNSYGSLSGLIAASHHWPIEELTARLQKRVGAIAGLPNDWHIDPVKIACLLRCADAAQIDMHRAPEFLFSLLKLRGVSADHWVAQNKLAQPIADPDDESAMLFSSTGPYSQENADAWWVAWDLISIVDRQLQASAALLKNTQRPAFKISRVRDADSPHRLSEHLTTLGWRPIRAEVTASDPVKLASILGGTALYGHDPLVPIRELIQNSADAVLARKSLERRPDFKPTIWITLRTENDDADESVIRYWLDFEDNGVGMSEHVLSSILLDFGSSLWSSPRAQQEFPGLRGSLFRSGGRFGIGFYSIFMIADYVRVTSRRYDAGIERARTILFRDGLRQRPIVVDANPSEISTNAQTKISMRIESSREKRLLDDLQKQRVMKEEKREEEVISFAQRVSVIAPTVNCNIYVSEFGSEPQLCHSENWYDEPAEEWLRSITLADVIHSSELDAAIKEAAPRLTNLKQGDEIVGRAAISCRAREPISSTDRGTSTFQPGIVTHGGLSSTSQIGTRISFHAAPFIGAVEMLPRGANRYYHANSGIGEYSDKIIADEISLKKWLEDQENKLDPINDLNLLNSAFIHFSQFGKLSKRLFFMRKFHIDDDVNKLSDVKIITFDDIIQSDKSSPNDFSFISTSKHIVPLVYFDSNQFDSLRNIMTDKNLDTVYFPPMETWKYLDLEPEENVESCCHFIDFLTKFMAPLGWQYDVEIQRLENKYPPIEYIDQIITLSGRSS